MKAINRLSFVVCLAMCVTLVFACGGNDSGTGGGSNAGSNPSATTTSSNEVAKTEPSGGKLTGMMYQSRYTEGLQNMFSKLEREEGITIDMQVIPDEQYENLLTMRVNAGEAPDLIDYNMSALYDFLDAPSLLVDLSDSTWVSRMVNPDMSIHKDGNIYGWAYESTNGFLAMLYNKDLFASVGYHEPPTTVAEFDDLCEKLLAKGITPIGQPSDSWVPQIYMTAGYSRALGSPEKIDEFAESISNGTKKLTDYPEIIAVLDHYVSLFHKGYVNDDYLTTNIEGIQTKIVNGEIAMMISSSGLFATLMNNNPDANMGVFNLPTNYDTQDVLSGSMWSKSFCIPKTSKNIDLAKKALEILSTPEYLDVYFSYIPGFPAYDDVDGGDLHPEVLQLYNKYKDSGNMVSEMNNELNLLRPLFTNTLWIYYQEAPGKGWSGRDLLEQFQKDVDIFLAELEG